MSDHRSAPLEVEESGVHSGHIAVWAISFILLFLGSLVGIRSYFVLSFEAETQRKHAAVQNPVLLELRAVEREQLNTLKVLDSTTGSYQIPIHLAMERIAAEGLKNKNAEASVESLAVEAEVEEAGAAGDPVLEVGADTGPSAEGAHGAGAEKAVEIPAEVKSDH